MSEQQSEALEALNKYRESYGEIYSMLGWFLDAEAGEDAMPSGAVDKAWTAFNDAPGDLYWERIESALSHAEGEALSPGEKAALRAEIKSDPWQAYGLLKALDAAPQVPKGHTVVPAKLPEGHPLLRYLDDDSPGNWEAMVAEAGAATIDLSSGWRTSFKAFHASLCRRFGYTHDERYWWRDLVSLEEHIASQEAPEATRALLSELYGSLERATPPADESVENVVDSCMASMNQFLKRFPDALERPMAAAPQVALPELPSQIIDEGYGWLQIAAGEVPVDDAPEVLRAIAKHQVDAPTAPQVAVPAAKDIAALTDRKAKLMAAGWNEYCARVLAAAPAGEQLFGNSEEFDGDVVYQYRHRNKFTGRAHEWITCDAAMVDHLRNGDDPEAPHYEVRELVPRKPVGVPVGLPDRVLMPRALTAENGAKTALSGEFDFSVTMTCPECHPDDPNPDCEVCAGSVEYEQPHSVPWATIKRIYSAAVDLLATPAPDEREIAVIRQLSEIARNSDYEVEVMHDDYVDITRFETDIAEHIADWLDKQADVRLRAGKEGE